MRLALVLALLAVGPVLGGCDESKKDAPAASGEAISQGKSDLKWLTSKVTQTVSVYPSDDMLASSALPGPTRSVKGGAGFLLEPNDVTRLELPAFAYSSFEVSGTLWNGEPPVICAVDTDGKGTCADGTPAEGGAFSMSLRANLDAGTVALIVAQKPLVDSLRGGRNTNTKVASGYLGVTWTVPNTPPTGAH